MYFENFACEIVATLSRPQCVLNYAHVSSVKSSRSCLYAAYKPHILSDMFICFRTDAVEITKWTRTCKIKLASCDRIVHIKDIVTCVSLFVLFWVDTWSLKLPEFNFRVGFITWDPFIHMAWLQFQHVKSNPMWKVITYLLNVGWNYLSIFKPLKFGNA